MLRAFVLTTYHNPGRNMRNTDRGLRLVYVLPAGSGGAENIDFQILGIDFDLGFINFRQYGNRDCRCVNASARLGLGHALYAVNPAFIFEQGITTLSGDAENHLFKSPFTG